MGVFQICQYLLYPLLWKWGIWLNKVQHIFYSIRHMMYFGKKTLDYLHNNRYWTLRKILHTVKQKIELFIMTRVLCRIQFLPAPHFSVGHVMLSHISTYQLRCDLSPEINYDTHVSPITRHNWQYLWLFCLFSFYLSTNVSTHPQRGLPVEMKGGQVTA